MNDDVVNDELMKCLTCGTERVSRYAAYCHICGSPLPELPPAPEDDALHGQPPAPPQPGPGDARRGAVAGGAAGYAAGQGQAPASPERQVYAARPVEPAPPASQPPGAPPSGGGPVRVFDRPEVPPSAERRKRMMLAIAAIGVLVSLLLLMIGPLRNAFSAREDPGWTPPGTQTPVASGTIGATGTVTEVASLPPGVSAAQATARARQGAVTVAPTWTAGVDIGGTTTAGGQGALPTLAPAPTTTPQPTATPAPTATAAPTATPQPAAAQSPAVPPTPGTGGGAALPSALAGGRALAFVSDRSGSPQIWVMDAAGANQFQLTQSGRNTSPAWSPDNRFLYYIGERDGETAVYRLDITSGQEERLLADPNIVSARPLPGGQLALVRMEDGLYSLYVGDRRLFQLDRSFQFQFSTDGGRVVIDPNAPPRVITVVDVATTQATEVAPANSWNAGWGPGNRLTYVSDRTGIASVYVAGPNGEEARPVSPGDKWSQAPAFSSDGGQIAFIAGDGAAWNVYAVPSTGGDARRVGGPANPGKSPAWQPAGRLIAYESDRAGNWDIYVSDPEGQERALTKDPGNDVDPAWTW